MQRTRSWVAPTALLLINVFTTSCLGARSDRELEQKAGTQADVSRSETEAFIESDYAPDPPAARSEIAPPRPSERHVWIDGSYVWRVGRWFWVQGYWAVPPRAGAKWNPGHWSRREDGFVWVAGTWR